MLIHTGAAVSFGNNLLGNYNQTFNRSVDLACVILRPGKRFQANDVYPASCSVVIVYAPGIYGLYLQQPGAGTIIDGGLAIFWSSLIESKVVGGKTSIKWHRLQAAGIIAVIVIFIIQKLATILVTSQVN